MRRILLFVFLFNQWVAGAPNDDVYAVYSTVLEHPIWDHADNGSILLIAQSTGSTYGGMDPNECIQAPPEYHSQLAEALADYTSRKSAKEQLRPDFKLTRPYKLLTDKESEQLANFRFCRTAPEASLTKLFAQTPDLIRLSPVFFSKDHRLAMVLVSNYCGGLCGGERWNVLIRRNGAWTPQHWVVCSAIS